MQASNQNLESYKKASVIGDQRQQASYGTWESPFTVESITAGVKTFADVVIDGDCIYWHEMRPDEAGRMVIMRLNKNGATDTITPKDFNVRTKVHEYGGTSFAVANGVIYFVNFVDQRIYVQSDAAAAPKPLTAAGIRYADLQNN